MYTYIYIYRLFEIVWKFRQGTDSDTRKSLSAVVALPVGWSVSKKIERKCGNRTLLLLLDLCFDSHDCTIHLLYNLEEGIVCEGKQNCMIDSGAGRP